MWNGKTKRVLSGILRALTLLLLCWEAVLSASPSVRVAWDPNPETNIKGYRIYYGEVSSGPTNLVDVGNQTTGTITNLVFATSYFFYVTAYNVFDLESDPSEALYYTTPVISPLALSTDGYLIALAPSVVTLRATLQGDPQPETSLVIDWQQGSGPESLIISNKNTLTPTVPLSLPGFYTFSVSVTEGSKVFQSSVSLEVYAAQAAIEDTALRFGTPFRLVDGLSLSWSSKAGYKYTLGIKRDLTDDFWVLVDRDIPSQGEATYWLDDLGLSDLEKGFFTVFELP